MAAGAEELEYVGFAEGVLVAAAGAAAGAWFGITLVPSCNLS